MELYPDGVKKNLHNVLVFLAAVTAVFFMVGWYYHFSRVQEQTRIDQLIQESATQSVTLIQERIFSDTAYIEKIARHIGQQTAPIASDEILHSIQGERGISDSFASITIATADGTLYDSGGKVLDNITKHAHFKSAMSGNIAISDMENLAGSGEHIFCVTAPIERNGEILGVVNGQVLLSSLENLLITASSFGGRGYNYIAHATGEIITQTDNANLSLTNFYDSFASFPSVSTAELEEMRQNIASGNADCITYTYGNEKRTMNYMALGINDWYLLSVLPNQVISSYAMALTQQIFTLIGALLVVSLLLIFYINKARRANQKALAAVHEELLTIYNTIPGGVFKCCLDDHFTLVEANDGFYRFIGYSKETFQTLFANQLIRIMQPEDVERVRATLKKQIEFGGTASEEVRFVRGDGGVQWLLLSGDILRNTTGKLLLYCCFNDISELKQTQEELRRSKQRYDLIVEETQEIIFEWDPIQRTIHHSKIFEKKFGYPCVLENFPESIFEQHLVPEEDRERCLAVYRKIMAGNHFSTGEFRIKKADGSMLWCRVSITAVLDNENHLCRAVGVISDIDYAKQELQAVTEKAQRDAMTGLYNKTTTEHLIEQRLQMPVAQGALLTVDIDNFKDVNDTLGHAAGDAALIEVAHQLKHLFRASDIVGRIGGDEFTVFVEGLEPGADLQEKLAAISEVFNWSFRKKDINYSVSCSIGVALFPRDGRNYAALSSRADAALYFAKQTGKNRFAIYSEDMQQSIHGLEQALSTSFGNDLFRSDTARARGAAMESGLTNFDKTIKL